MGFWSTTRHYAIQADHSRVVLDLRDACRRFTEVTVRADLAKSTLVLLVDEGTQVDDTLRRTGKGRLKDRQPSAHPSGALTITGDAHGSEVRIHRGGMATLHDPTSVHRLRELRAAEGATEVEHVPVLVVGGGYAGTTMAMFLAHNGIRVMMVDRHDQPSVQGRARGVNQRTMEVYRSVGVDRQVEAQSAPFTGDAGVARCAPLSAPWEWLFDPEPDPRLQTITPAHFVMADQNSVEPVLTRRACELGARIERGLVADQITVADRGAEVTLRDITDGTTRRVHCDYLIAADGYAGGIRGQLGIQHSGSGDVQHWASIVFEADLDDLVTQRALFWIVLNEQLGFASLTTTAERHRWSLGLVFDPDTKPLASFDTAACVEAIRAALGDPDRDVRIVDVTPWQQAVGVADSYRHGCAFLVGDAAHVWPPAGAMGANSAVQDAHNLAWKLAAVLDGRADPTLLETYAAERKPVADALADLTVRRQAARFGGGLEDDIDDLVCTLGQRYDSPAILGAGAAVPFTDTVAEVAEPGARMPHTWIDSAHQRSILDATGTGFVLAVREGADVWRSGLEPYGVTVHQTDPPVLGPGVGAALIRPDGYVAWVAKAPTPDVESVLDAMHRVLGHTTYSGE